MIFTLLPIFFILINNCSLGKGAFIYFPTRQNKLNRVVLYDAAYRKWLIYQDPLDIVEARSISEVEPALQQIESTVEKQNLFAAGFVCYEAAPAFDPALSVHPPSGLPLVWFGLYRRPESVRPPGLSRIRDYQLGKWKPSVTRGNYMKAIHRIRGFIADGETYQVNYTFRMRTSFRGNPLDFYLDLTEAQRSRYCAYAESEAWVICSASPELFFELSNRCLISRPMKGTASRGLTFEADQGQSDALYRSDKDRAENVMIVDMVRNDMGHVAAYGSVKVPALYQIEKYPTLWQMTSTITSQTDASVTGIFKAMFPFASITGAPKPRTMQIISELETGPRGIYTGAMGFIHPNRHACFNVAIRTVCIQGGQAEYGTGGGIVWDSIPEKEFEEGLMKTRVLNEKGQPFSIFESFLWSPEDGYFLEELHLQRFMKSIDYFQFPVTVDKIREQLKVVSENFPDQPHKVKILADAEGTLEFVTEIVDPEAASKILNVNWAKEPVNSNDLFLYHKTTNRHYHERAIASRPDADDVILWNERGEVTEASSSNIIVERDGQMWTPPVSCGLLPGTYREWMLRQGTVKEKVILKSSLKSGDSVILINSVRKNRKAVLVENG